MKPQVPFRVDIQPFESGRGYLLRLADQLEYSGPMLVKSLAGISDRGPSDSSALRRLADFLRQDFGTLSDHFYISREQLAATPQIPFFGQLVHRDFINHGTSKVCPECLVDGRPAQGIWDLGLVLACPDHVCRLVDTCFQCGKSLSWLRPRLSRCSCGADLNQTEAVKAATAEIAIACLIQRAVVGPADYPLIHYGYCPALLESGLQNLLRVIEFAGAKFHRFLSDFSVSYRRRGDPRQSREIIGMAHEILTEWPANLHKRLRQISLKARDSANSDGVYARAFNAFYRYRFPKGAGLDFIKDELMEFSGTTGNRPLRLIGRRREEEQEQHAWLTPPEAAAMVGDISPAVFHHLAKRGILKSKVEDDGKRRRGVWIDRGSIVDWLKDGHHWISSRDAKALLGMPLSLMLKVSKAGLMETRRGGVPRLLETRNFRKADVERIAFSFRRCDLSVVKAAGNSDWVALRKLSACARLNDDILEQAVAAVCEGRLEPVGQLSPNAGVLDYVFDKAALNRVIRAPNGHSRADLMNLSEVQNVLTASQDLVDALVKAELLVPLPRNGKHLECLFIKRDVFDFDDAYILASRLARELRTQSAWLRRTLSRLGVEGMTVHYRYATTVLYRKNEIRQHIGILNELCGRTFVL